MRCLGPLSLSVEPEKDHQLILGAAMIFPQVLLHLLITISVIPTRITTGHSMFRSRLKNTFSAGHSLIMAVNSILFRSILYSRICWKSPVLEVVPGTLYIRGVPPTTKIPFNWFDWSSHHLWFLTRSSTISSHQQIASTHILLGWPWLHRHSFHQRIINVWSTLQGMTFSTRL